MEIKLTGGGCKLTPLPSPVELYTTSGLGVLLFATGREFFECDNHRWRARRTLHGAIFAYWYEVGRGGRFLSRGFVPLSWRLSGELNSPLPPVYLTESRAIGAISYSRDELSIEVPKDLRGILK